MKNIGNSPKIQLGSKEMCLVRQGRVTYICLNKIIKLCIIVAIHKVINYIINICWLTSKSEE